MILVLGKNGQVGKALVSLLGRDALAFDSSELDLSAHNLSERLDMMSEGKTVTALINAAAYTQVDKAEEEREQAMRINGTAPGELAAWCKARNIPLVHFSTDYVFDGSGYTPRGENENTGPLNVYGESKLLGEKRIVSSGADYLVFRTSWVYDEAGRNFFTTMLRLFCEREELQVVADQIGAPTYAPHLARAALDALKKAQSEKKFPSGIYHLCAGGEASWHDFAVAILALARPCKSGIKCGEIQPIATSDYPTQARRPLNSRLDCAKAKQSFGVQLPDWKDGVIECYENIRLRH